MRVSGAPGLGFALATVLAGCAAGRADAPAAAASCRYEQNCECAVPGVTLRWKAASCMAAAETDDLEQAGVQRCLQAPDPPAVASLDPCARNLHWKRVLCAATSAPDRVDGCVHDATIIPAVVAGTSAAGLGEQCPDPRSARADLARSAR